MKERQIRPFIISSFTPHQVSWVRHRDVHILSSNGVTFTSDSRFKVRADEDEGSYECQISTKPTKTLIVNLFVTGEDA